MDFLWFVTEVSLKTSVVWLMLTLVTREPANLITRSVLLKEMWIVAAVYSFVWTLY